MVNADPGGPSSSSSLSSSSSSSCSHCQVVDSLSLEELHELLDFKDGKRRTLSSKLEALDIPVGSADCPKCGPLLKMSNLELTEEIGRLDSLLYDPQGNWRPGPFKEIRRPINGNP